MEPFYLMLGGLALLFGGTFGKNKFEDEVTARKDSFKAYDALFEKYGRENEVSPWMMKAIAMNESSLGENEKVKHGMKNPYDIEGSKSDDGLSWGFMQFTIPTARDFDSLATEVKLNNPEYSIKLAAKFLRSLLKQFPKETYPDRWEEYVVKSYNQGAGNTRKEISGKSQGFAQTYWERYQRNRALIHSKQGV